MVAWFFSATIVVGQLGDRFGGPLTPHRPPCCCRYQPPPCHRDTASSPLGCLTRRSRPGHDCMQSPALVAAQNATRRTRIFPQLLQALGGCFPVIISVGAGIGGAPILVRSFVGILRRSELQSIPPPRRGTHLDSVRGGHFDQLDCGLLMLPLPC